MSTEKNIALPFELDLVEAIETRNTKGEVIDTKKSLTFRNKLNAGMLGDMPAGDTKSLAIKHFFPIISKMTGETVETIQKLGFTDFQECMDVVSHFLDNGQNTGDK